MKPSEIYREAARRIEVENDYSCIVLAQATDPLYESGKADRFTEEYETVRKYVDMFGDGNSIELQHRLENSQDLRVLALCFMGAIADDEERRSRRSRRYRRKHV